MRLLPYQDFCKMPAGTIFAPYIHGVLADVLTIKVNEGCDVSTRIHKFCGVMPLAPWNAGDVGEASFEVCDSNDIDYKGYEYFVILDQHDIDKMIEVLKWAKDGCKGDLNGN